MAKEARLDLSGCILCELPLIGPRRCCTDILFRSTALKKKQSGTLRLQSPRFADTPTRRYVQLAVAAPPCCGIGGYETCRTLRMGHQIRLRKIYHLNPIVFA